MFICSQKNVIREKFWYVFLTLELTFASFINALLTFFSYCDVFWFYNTVSVLLCACGAIPEHTKMMKLDINLTTTLVCVFKNFWRKREDKILSPRNYHSFKKQLCEILLSWNWYLFWEHYSSTDHRQKVLLFE